MKVSKKAQAELEEIRKANGGKLSPEAVVEYAKNPKSSLHSQFTWDDGEAAHKWRLSQAAHIIRVCVIIIPNVNEPVRAYVSLMPDRKPSEGFYRSTVEVANNRDLREIMLEDAKAELQAFVDKYQALTELNEVFEVIERTLGKKKHNKARLSINAV